MATTIKLKNGSGAPLAGDLVQGEPALDLTNKRLYTEDSGGTVIEVGTNPSTLTVDTTTLVVDAGNNRVGIGTTSPTTKLDVFGKQRIYLNNTSVGNASSLQLTQDGTGDAAISFLIGATTEWLAGVDNSDSDSFKISNITGGGDFTSTGMTLTTAGNVGIGTSSPGHKLQVNASAFDGIQLQSAGTDCGYLGVNTGTVYVGAGSTLAFHTGNSSLTNGSERMRIDSSGNVGIGAAPVNGYGKLQLRNSFIYVNEDGADTKQLYLRSDFSGNPTIQVATAHALTFATSNAERMRIDSSGRTLIGTTVADQDAKLTVVGSGAGGSSPATISTNTVATFRRTGGLSHSANVSILGGSTGFSVLNLGDRDDEDVGRVYYDHTNNAMLFDTNAVERMRIDGVGNVGIGTSSPFATARLQVKTGTNLNLAVQTGTTETSGMKINAFNDAATANIPLELNGSVTLLKTGETERMRIDSSGRLGIGTTSPSGSLHVSNTNTTIRITDTASTADYSFQATANDIRLYDNTASQERMRIDSAGNVGIGRTPETVPEHCLDVQPSGNAGRFRVTANSSVQFIGSAGAGGMYIDSVGVADNIIFRNTGSFTERMRIDSSGTLMVGKTSGSIQPEGLLLYGNGEIYSTIASGGGDSYVLYDTTNNAYRFRVSSAGQISATSTSITAISDASLKENVRDLDKGLDTINALQPRRFDWKNGDGNDIMGFIAQEVEEVMPELVHEYKYSDEENKKGLKMGDMVPSMVKAIQELSAQVTELKAEVAALKGA